MLSKIFEQHRLDISVFAKKVVVDFIKASIATAVLFTSTLIIIAFVSVFVR